MEESKSDFSEPQVVKEEHVTPRRTRKQKVGNICKRFWWLFILIVAVLVLVIVLPIIYVGYPRMAQSAVNDSTLNITSMSLLHPQPDSFVLNQVAIINSKSAFHPNLDAFNATVSLPGAPSPFMTVEIPAIKAQNGANASIQGQLIKITDVKAFTQYTESVLANETVTLLLKGRTGLREGQLQKTNVNFDKTIIMKGLNGLANFSIENLKVNLTGVAEDGTNLYADVSIPNPTVQTIELGDVFLSMSVPVANGSQNISYPVGTTTLYNTTLSPGDNSIPFRAITNQTLLLGLVSKNPAFLKGIPVDIKTENCTVNGVDIPYLTGALSATTLHTILDISKAL